MPCASAQSGGRHSLSSGDFGQREKRAGGGAGGACKPAGQRSLRSDG